MDAYILLIPVILIRYILLFFLSRSAFKNAAFSPPVVGGERRARFIYQTFTVMIFAYMFMLKVEIGSSLFYIGLAIYSIGVLLCVISTINYAKPAENGFSQNGLYRFSRNPMYIAYFISFLGCAVLTKSNILLAIVMVYQISAHWIIRSEERWCKEKFGEEYIQYMNKVRRYI